MLGKLWSQWPASRIRGSDGEFPEWRGWRLCASATSGMHCATGRLTEPLIDLVSSLVGFESGDVKIEVVGAPFTDIAGSARGMEVEVDADEVGALGDRGIFKVRERS